ncbi:MAG TPA: helix-turn-helix transcriptional regulator [Acidimicrobiales bacterium]|nr:helix-turn-helix transcriptional regulator [Acidimicrobiales bacterium]
MSARQEWAFLAAHLRAKGKTRAEIAQVLRERFGLGALAALRHAHGWSQHDAAKEWTRRWSELPKSYKDFSGWETGRHTPPLDVFDKLAEMYSCDLADVLADRRGYREHDEAHDGDPPQRVERAPAELDEVERVRAATESTLTRGTATAAVLDDIGDLIDHRAGECVTAPPAPMLDRLIADMGDLQRLAADRQPVAVLRHLNRFTSQLAALIGVELMVLGQVVAARAWLRVGFSAAVEAEAPPLGAHLSAFRATLYLYFGDAAEAARLAGGAVHAAAGDRGPVSALALALEAVALAQLGDLAGSEQSRHGARAAFERMDGDDRTVFGFSERRLAFYESRALSEAARRRPDRFALEAAFAAQDRAIDAYPPDAVGDTTLMALDRALCLVAAGDTAAACDLAQRTLADLPDEHRAPIFTEHGRLVARVAGDPAGRDLERWLAQPSLR